MAKITKALRKRLHAGNGKGSENTVDGGRYFVVYWPRQMEYAL
ncbi:hypothetical protein B4110_2210 [Parageobacillus toebii]|uniref:Uncharacterized protein n=1 Tax=Parageobacillus toebii TaxID=153151 RepID=A0A150N1G1_9BACL|nr:hypothetical protein B4110_2210 [Parageobacillus toebii]